MMGSEDSTVKEEGKAQGTGQGDDVSVIVAPPPRLPVRDRVILHLNDFNDFIDEFEMPFAITQAGIAKRVRSHRAQVTKVLMGLKQRDYLLEKVNHVTNEKRRRKVYFLTPLGMAYAKKLEAFLDENEVNFSDLDGKKDTLSLTEIRKRLGDRVSILSLLDEAADGTIEQEGLIQRLERKGMEAESEHGPDVSEKELRRMEREARKEFKEEKRALRFLRYGLYPPPSAGMMAPSDEAEGASEGPEDEVVVIEEGERPVQEPIHGTLETGTMDRPMAPPLFPPPSVIPYAPGHIPTRAPTGGTRHLAQYPTSPYAAYTHPYLRPQIIIPFHAPPRRGSFFASLVLMVLMVLFAPFIFFGMGGPFCFIELAMLVISLTLLGLYSFWKGRMGKGFMDRTERRAVTATAFSMGFIGAFWMAMVTTETFEPTMFWAFITVAIPLYITLMFARPIPAVVRGGIAQSIGIFTMGLAALSYFATEAIVVPPDYILLWMLVGLGTMFVGREVHFTTLPSSLRSALPGLGTLLVLMCSVILYEGWPMEPMEALTTVLWMATGLLFIAAPFISKVKQRHLLSGLGNGLMIGAGVALLTLGSFLVYHKIYFGIAEVLIALPVLYYGLARMKALKGLERWRSSLLLVFIIILELTTFYIAVQYI